MKQEYNRTMEQVRLSPEGEARIQRALTGGETGNRRPAGRPWRAALAAAAALALMTGTAFAVAYQTGVLEAFFQGDTSQLEPYVQTQVDSAENRDYRLTVDSTLNDGRTLYAVITVEGLNEQAAADLMSNKVIAESHREMWGQDMVDMLMEDGGSGPETFWAYFVDSGESVSGMGTHELPAPSATSRSWRLQINMSDVYREQQTGPIALYLNFIGRDYAVQIPTDVTVEVSTLPVEREVTLSPGSGERVYVDSLELSPISLTYVGELVSDDNTPPLFFRRTDGTVVTPAQLGLSFRRMENPQGYPIVIYQTDTPMPVEEFASVILGDTEFPLDGSAPFPAEVDEKLYPFEIGLLRYPVLDVGERNYVADVADLCQKLGAEYAWDEAAGTATATYRGVTITLTAGSATALVDGEAMELYTDCTLEDGTEQRVELPVLEEDGTVSALITVFTQSWSMDVEVEREGGDVPVYTGFIVIP